ncbi:MAG: GNAT family N-acetyltransferase [Pseudomonadota bacterium]
MLNWQWRSFNDLTTRELYAILKLRAEVFIVEQNCVWQDLDDQDQLAMHLLGLQDQTLVAYARVLPVNPQYPDWVSIGRIVTKNTVRGQGLGKQAVTQALNYLQEQNNQMPVVISAQIYLKKFYMSFGFQPEGEPYDEDGIIHTKMRLVTP